MYTVGYVIRSLTKAQRKRKSQVISKPRATNRSNHDSKSLFVTNPQSTSYSATNLDSELDIILSK